MKRLFFFLCLLNAAYLLWQFHVGRLNPQPKKQLEPSTILLVSEYEHARHGADITQRIERNIEGWQASEIDWIYADLKNEQWKPKFKRAPVVKKSSEPEEIKKAPEPVKPVIKVAEKKCFEVGPFEDELSVKNWLKEKALAKEQIMQKDVAIPNDYQVYYPAAKTEEDSRINKMLLQAKGVQDIWQIPSGELKGAYSLGVFREKQRALVWQRQLAEKEIQAQIKQRDKMVPKWFAKIRLEKANVKQYASQEVKFSSCSAD